MKKIISVIIFAAVLSMLSIVCSAEEATVNFANGGNGSNLIAVSKNATSVEFDGITGWQVPVGSYYYINCNVDDSVLYDYRGKSTISVKYYDGDSGKFCLQYVDTAGSTKYAETVTLSGTNSWKTYIYILEDCVYSNGILGYDFKINLQDAAGRSTSPVVFSEIIVVTQSVNSEMSIENTGHVFSDNEDVKFNILLENKKSEKRIGTISAEIYDSEEKKVTEVTREVEIAPSTSKNEYILLDTLPKGFYKAKLRTVFGNEINEENLRFSISKESEEYTSDSIFGTCLHISRLKEDSEQMNSMMSMLNKAGVDWIRDEYYWDAVEKEKGVYNFYADGYVNACIENNINPMILLSYANTLYGGVPHDEEGYVGFANYAKAVATHLKGKVKTYEVWNEWNGGTWSGGYGTAEYANILKYTYEALKSVDPEITVVAGATIMASTGWFDELFSMTIDGKSMYEYCDAISYHPYCYPNSPDDFIEAGNIENNAFSMYHMMKKYGTPKPQYITELGWFTGSAGRCVSEKTQADYLARTYISGMAYGVEKIFWYDFKDDGTDLANSENNYGIINSWDDSEEIKYEPKPAFLASAAVTSILKGTEFVKEYRPRENVRIYKFVNEAENREVHAMYTSNNEEIDFLLTGDNLKLKTYDIYGNECMIKTLSGSPVYVEGNIGQFDISGILTDVRYHAIATFGYSHKYDGLQVVGEENPTTANSRNVYGITKNNGIICDIDDSWIYSNSAKLKITVDYYDKGSGSFYVKYKDSTGTVKVTNSVSVNGGGWKTAEFVINDINATNVCSDGDFEIVHDDSSGTIYVTAVKARELNTGTPVLVAEFDNSEFTKLNDGPMMNTVDFGGLMIRVDNNSNGDFKYVTRNNRGGIYVPAVNGGYYISTYIDDDVLFGGVNSLTVYVDYFDEGTGNFDIAYDKGKYDFSYPTYVPVYLQDTKEWKTAKFTIDNTWLENHSVDLRIALWTGHMPVSTQGIVFGGIRIEDNLENPDFNLDFDRDTKTVKIDGYFKNQYDHNKPVTVQILKQGKDAADLSEVTSANISDYIRYVSQTPVESFYEYYHYEKEFQMDDSAGVYLVRVRLPEEDVILEKYLYYNTLYDIDNITIRDSKGNEVDDDSLAGIEEINISAEAESRYGDMNICMAAAVYDKHGRLCGVDFIEDTAVAGEVNSLVTNVTLPHELKAGDKVKILLLRDSVTFVPITAARVVNVK